jgi:predicted secreted protein
MEENEVTKEGYIHGSNMILSVNDVPLGHSKSCQIQNQAETKDRATKEVANGKWNDKSVSKLSVSISAEGFVFADDKMGYDTLLELWEKGEAVDVKYAYRGEESTCYRTGKFLITSLEESDPADDDSTYSISLENSGEVKRVTVA